MERPKHTYSNCLRSNGSSPPGRARLWLDQRERLLDRGSGRQKTGIMSWRWVSGPAHQASLPGSLKMPSFGSFPESSGSEPANARSLYKRPSPKGCCWLLLPQCHERRRRNAMRWFRSRARLGSGLALFALVAQLTLRSSIFTPMRARETLACRLRPRTCSRRPTRRVRLPTDPVINLSPTIIALAVHSFI